MKISRHFFVLICLIIFSTNSYADSPTFTYAEVEYITNGDFFVSDDDLTVDLGLDGFALNLSAELGIILIQASRFELESSQILGSNLEDNISTFALGLTFEFPRTSVYGLARVRRDELSLVGGGFDEDEQGTTIGFEAGVRFNLTNSIELNANLGRPSPTLKALALELVHNISLQTILALHWILARLKLKMANSKRSLIPHL